MVELTGSLALRLCPGITTILGDLSCRGVPPSRFRVRWSWIVCRQLSMESLTATTEAMPELAEAVVVAVGQIRTNQARVGLQHRMRALAPVGPVRKVERLGAVTEEMVSAEPVVVREAPPQTVLRVTMVRTQWVPCLLGTESTLVYSGPSMIRVPMRG
jgi:hypothetical protein